LSGDAKSQQSAGPISKFFYDDPVNCAKVTSFLLRDYGSTVGLVLCMQDYKSLCAAFTICANLINIHSKTDRQTDSILINTW